MSEIHQANASDIISNDYLDEDREAVPAGLYLDEVVAGYEVEESEREIDATIWFISLLTRIDGLVLLGPAFDVAGFGVEITCAEAPLQVYRASDADGVRLKELDYEHFGTRHRSMVRYCAKVPGSIGFVVSQDGDVRAIATLDGRLVVFENLRLQASKFPPAAVRHEARRQVVAT